MSLASRLAWQLDSSIVGGNETYPGCDQASVGFLGFLEERRYGFKSVATNDRNGSSTGRSRYQLAVARACQFQYAGRSSSFFWFCRIAVYIAFSTVVHVQKQVDNKLTPNACPAYSTSCACTHIPELPQRRPIDAAKKPVPLKRSKTHIAQAPHLPAHAEPARLGANNLRSKPHEHTDGIAHGQFLARAERAHNTYIDALERRRVRHARAPRTERKEHRRWWRRERARSRRRRR